MSVCAVCILFVSCEILGATKTTACTQNYLKCTKYVNALKNDRAKKRERASVCQLGALGARNNLVLVVHAHVAMPMPLLYR